MHFSLVSPIAIGLFALNAVAAPVQDLSVRLVDAKSKTSVDAATYSNLVHYAAYPRVGYTVSDTGSCAVPPYGTTMVEFFSVNDTDTQAILFRDDSRKEFIIGIPGTDGTQDFITDFTFLPVPYLAPNLECLGCEVHLGFYLAWKSIADDVTEALNKSLKAYPGYATVISGHSLGGAIGQLAFGALEPQMSSVSAYTYGQPRVGNALFATYIDGLAGASDTSVGTYHRTTHVNDGVPQLPPVILGFSHSRTEFWESADKPNVSTTYRCYGDEPADCNNLNNIGFNYTAHSTYAGLTYDCTTGVQS